MSTAYTPTRQRILTIAERRYRDTGPSGLSIRQIAQEVGVTPMAIYRHFRDKDAIIEALVSAGFQKWEKQFAAAPEAQAPLDRIRAGLLSYVEFALEEREQAGSDPIEGCLRFSRGGELLLPFLKSG